mgnify:CR=1 FL=1
MKAKKIAGIIVFLLCAAALPAAAKPGPVVLTFMERVESQSDAISSSATRDASGETFLYSMISAFRKLDNDVTGNLYYLNKYSIDDGANASHIWGLNIARTLTNKWKVDLSFSHSSSPQRNTVPSSDSDRFSFGVTYKVNPLEKIRPRYTLKTTYSTGTDFSEGRTLSQKASMADSLSKAWSYNLGYTFVWGLNENGTTLFKEHYTNQYQGDLTYKIDRKQRVTIGVLYLQQLYHSANAANRSDSNMLTRVSYFYSYY